MLIGYLQRSSLIEYPSKVSAVIFTIGCNFRCPYCHNPELVHPQPILKSVPEKEVFDFLEKRRGKLDAVAITGGEPCIQEGLIPFMSKVKSMGFLVKLDTNGSFPDVLAHVIQEGVADYIAMDVKAPLHKYHDVAGTHVETQAVQSSIRSLLESDIPYEFRTTLVAGLLSCEDVIEIGGLIQGARQYFLQKYVASKPLDPAFLNAETFPEGQMERLVRELKPLVGRCAVRS